MFVYWIINACYLFDRSFDTYPNPTAHVGYPPRSKIEFNTEQERKAKAEAEAKKAEEAESSSG